MSNYIIYGVRNKLNGKWYVGYSKDLTKRWRGHLSDAKSTKGKSAGRCLHEAMRKDDLSSFNLYVLDHADNKTDAEALEIIWTRKKGSIFPNGYNLTGGGAGAGVTPCAETRKLMSIALTGRTFSPETHRKMSEARIGRPGNPNPLKGKSLPALWRAKLSAGHRGHPSGMAGKHHSPETRAKISAANKGRPGPGLGKPLSEKHKQKLSIVLTGRTFSPETIKRMSEARSRYWALKKSQTPTKGLTCNE